MDKLLLSSYFINVNMLIVSAFIPRELFKQKSKESLQKKRRHTSVQPVDKDDHQVKKTLANGVIFVSYWFRGQKLGHTPKQFLAAYCCKTCGIPLCEPWPKVVLRWLLYATHSARWERYKLLVDSSSIYIVTSFYGRVALDLWDWVVWGYWVTHFPSVVATTMYLSHPWGF